MAFVANNLGAVRNALAIAGGLAMVHVLWTRFVPGASRRHERAVSAGLSLLAVGFVVVYIAEKKWRFLGVVLLLSLTISVVVRLALSSAQRKTEHLSGDSAVGPRLRGPFRRR